MKFTFKALAACLIASFGLAGVALADCNVTQTGISSHSETDCASAWDLELLEDRVGDHDKRLNAHDDVLASHGEALEQHADGLAIMSAMANPVWLESKEAVALSGGWGTFDGHHAFAGTVVVRIDEAWSMNGSAGTDINRNAWAARAGFRAGW